MTDADDRADDSAARTDANERRLRELARRLADNADDLAETFDRSAAIHEAVASDDQHPLWAGAAEHAAEERRVAAGEWDEAARLRRLAGGGLARRRPARDHHDPQRDPRAGRDDSADAEPAG